jgi:hypothetical protein
MYRLERNKRQIPYIVRINKWKKEETKQGRNYSTQNREERRYKSY